MTLEAMLAGCLRWEKDKPAADLGALGVAADWMEEHGDARHAVVREAIRFKPFAASRMVGDTQPVVNIALAGARGAGLVFGYLNAIPHMPDRGAVFNGFVHGCRLSLLNGPRDIFRLDWMDSPTRQGATRRARAAAGIIVWHAVLFLLDLCPLKIIASFAPTPTARRATA